MSDPIAGAGVTLSIEQVTVIVGLIINAVAVVKIAMIYERRMTKMETWLKILVKRDGFADRREDDEGIET